jgi:transposase-like protein
MTELAHHDRNAYRKLRSDIWTRIAQKHGRKTPAQLADWRDQSS